MKNITCFALLLSTFSFLTHTSAQAQTYPDKTYTVTLNLTNLAGYMANGPISLDLQLAQGSGNVTNTVTLSNFVPVGGTITASPNFTQGGVSGSLASGLKLTNSAPDNEFDTYLSAGITALSFNVDQTPNSEVVGTGTAVPDQFNVSLIDNNLNPIPTTDPSGGNTLVNSSLGAITTVNQYSIVAAPEPGTTGLLLVAGALAGVVALRRRLLA